MKIILWVEDQYEDLMDYSSCLSRMGYGVEPVRSVTEALERLEKEKYEVYVFDLKILPGDDPKWQNLDEQRRKEKPNFDPLLGLELLRSLHNARQEQNEAWEKIAFDFQKVVIFSVVNAPAVSDELETFGIPPRQIVYKSDSDLNTLAEVIKEMENPTDEDH